MVLGVERITEREEKGVRRERERESERASERERRERERERVTGDGFGLRRDGGTNYSQGKKFTFCVHARAHTDLAQETDLFFGVTLFSHEVLGFLGLKHLTDFVWCLV